MTTKKYTVELDEGNVARIQGIMRHHGCTPTEAIQQALINTVFLINLEDTGSGVYCGRLPNDLRRIYFPRYV